MIERLGDEPSVKDSTGADGLDDAGAGVEEKNGEGEEAEPGIGEVELVDGIDCGEIYQLLCCRGTESSRDPLA